MSISIYHSLYKYPSSDERTQLENYLTEAFIDILNRMKKDETILFLKECLLNNCNNGCICSEIFSKIEKAKHFSWKSQYAINYKGTNKYPDIALIVEEVFIFIENKVGAGFTYHMDNGDVINEDVSDYNQTQNQLEVYSQWLSESKTKGGLVLLTYNTNAPSDFLADNKKYPANLRAIANWKEVHKWFSRWSQEGNREHMRKKLAYEFVLFLEDIGMSDISNRDLSVLDLFLSNKINEKTESLMREARNIAQHIIVNPISKPQKHTNYWDDAHIFWDWFYCYEKEIEWYIAWGIRFPEGSDVWKGYGIPSYPQAFIDICSDNVVVPLSKIPNEKKIPSWYWITAKDEEHCIKAISVSELVASSSGFTHAFLHWLEKGLKEAIEIADKAYDIYKNNPK